MRDRILRTRLYAMNKNLVQVRSVLDAVRNWRQQMEGLMGLLGDPEEGAAEALGKASADMGHLERKPGIDKDLVARMKKELESAKKRVDDAIEILGSIERRALNIQEDGDLGKTLRLQIGLKAEGWIKTLEELDRGLSNGGASDDQMKAAWRKYSREVYEESVPVFAEYVDFLGGLALRDTGFDEGICQIADDLVRRCEMVPEIPAWESMTIPAHKEAVSDTLARIIRLGFPEWTIWALPLTSREFGYVVASKNVDLRNYVEKEAAVGQSEYMTHCMADAFGAYAMGPSYAFAAILLRLDPRSTPGGHGQKPSDLERAHVVLTMLRQMDKSSEGRPYKVIYQQLSAEWEAALEQVDTSGALDSATRQQLEDWVEHMRNFLARKAEVAYLEGNWRRIQEWTEHMKPETVKDITLQGTEDLRDVLNVAWLSRFESPFAKIETLAEAARKLWERIEQSRNRKRTRTWASRRQ